MLTDKQIAMRATRLGCSELYDLLKPGGAYRLWHHKQSGIPRFKGTEEFIRVGNLFEAPTAKLYAFKRKQQGHPVRLYQVTDEQGEGVTLLHPDHPWLMGTPDFLPVRVHRGMPDRITSLEDIWRLRDAGHIDAGLEIKTVSYAATLHAEDVDQWGDVSAPEAELIQFLGPHCHNAHWLAKQLKARYQLAPIPGADFAEDEEDAWGAPGSTQMPRRCLVQCLGYMELTGFRKWDLERLLGHFSITSATYQAPWDADVVGALMEMGAKFVRDHLETGKPPPAVTVDDRALEVARRFPVDNGLMLSMTPERAALIERYREATIAKARAEAIETAIKVELAELLEDAEGIDGGKGFKVTYGTRAGRVTLDGHKAVETMTEALQALVDRDALEAAKAEALAAATKQGAGYRQFSRPQTWTKGIEAEVLAAMKGGER